MNVQQFSNGDYVVHRFEGRYSVWFSAAGEVTDCEVTYNSLHRRLENSRRVPEAHVKVRARMKNFARRYVSGKS